MKTIHEEVSVLTCGIQEKEVTKFQLKDIFPTPEAAVEAYKQKLLETIDKIK